MLGYKAWSSAPQPQRTPSAGGCQGLTKPEKQPASEPLRPAVGINLHVGPLSWAHLLVLAQASLAVKGESWGLRLLQGRKAEQG